MDSITLCRDLEKKLTSIRQKKVQKIKNRIAAGKYQINTMQVAKVLIQLQ